MLSGINNRTICTLWAGLKGVSDILSSIHTRHTAQIYVEISLLASPAQTKNIFEIPLA